MATATFAFTADAAPGGRYRDGRQIVTKGVLTADNGDYAAGGIAVAASDFGLSRLDSLDVHGVIYDGSGGVLAEGAAFDTATSKITMWTGGADGDPFDESNTATLSGHLLRVTARGV